jgi:Zn finger protein HypA/HybF involved in hydrogenase expression
MNGCGTRLYSWHNVAPGVYEATLWICIFYIPIIPLCSWLIRPLSVVRSGFKYQFLDHRSMSAPLILKTYGFMLISMLAIFGPVVLAVVVTRSGMLAGLALAWGLVLGIVLIAITDSPFRAAQPPPPDPLTQELLASLSVQPTPGVRKCYRCGKPMFAADVGFTCQQCRGHPFQPTPRVRRCYNCGKPIPDNDSKYVCQECRSTDSIRAAD